MRRDINQLENKIIILPKPKGIIMESVNFPQKYNTIIIPLPTLFNKYIKLNKLPYYKGQSIFEYWKWF